MCEVEFWEVLEKMCKGFLDGAFSGPSVDCRIADLACYYAIHSDIVAIICKCTVRTSHGIESESCFTITVVADVFFRVRCECEP